MNNEIKFELIKIITSIILFILACIFDINILFYLSYVVVGYNVILNSIKNILHGKVFDENFLMTVATIGAFVIGEVHESVFVMLFYQIGELFQEMAVDNSKKSIVSLLNLRPDYANVIRNNKTIKVSPTDVNINEIIVIKPGEKVPLDGIIVSGSSSLNMSSLTGETKLVSVNKDDNILSGSINTNGLLKVKVTKCYQESTVNKILDLIENADNNKSKSESLITRIAKYYTPIVVLLSLLIAIFPPLVLKQDYNIWIYKSLSFLVASCPCALVISIPLTFFAGIGACSRNGILIKGSNYLEDILNCKTFIFDKTGTLTEGNFKVQNIKGINITERELLKIASYAEYYSNHPIAISIKEHYKKKINIKNIGEVKEISGKGIIADVFNKKVIIGNDKLLKDNKIIFKKCCLTGTIVYVAIDYVYSGYIVINDCIKNSSVEMVELLRKQGIKDIIMLSGDEDNICKEVSNVLKIDKYYSSLLPQDKVKIINDLKSLNNKIAFVGDGVNDAPAIAVSDIGISLGNIGSESAIEVSDIVIMNDNLSSISKCIHISKKTIKVVKENIIFSLSIKLLILIFISFGLLGMWSAVFADVGVSCILILNAIRILKIKY